MCIRDRCTVVQSKQNLSSIQNNLFFAPIAKQSFFCVISADTGTTTGTFASCLVPASMWRTCLSRWGTRHGTHRSHRCWRGREAGKFFSKIEKKLAATYLAVRCLSVKDPRIDADEVQHIEKYGNWPAPWSSFSCIELCHLVNAVDTNLGLVVVQDGIRLSFSFGRAMNSSVKRTDQANIFWFFALHNVSVQPDSARRTSVSCRLMLCQPWFFHIRKISSVWVYGSDQTCVFLFQLVAQIDGGKEIVCRHTIAKKGEGFHQRMGNEFAKRFVLRVRVFPKI